MRTSGSAFMLAASLLLGGAAQAQIGIDDTNKYGWGENIGFVNWADAGDGAQSARVHATYLSGFLWCENIGHVNLGDGSPTNGTSYANEDGSDFGVNLAMDGTLSGYAWSENGGWWNFDGGAMATPPQPARIDFDSGRFRGYVWTECCGWINLDDASTFVALACPCEFDGMPAQVDIFDLLAYLDAWFAGDAAAEYNGTPPVDIFDLLAYLDCWFTASASGCF